MIKINDFLNSDNDGLYYTGHASFIVRLSGKNYIFDYIRDNKPYGDLWVFYPELTKRIPWEKIDGIFVSHVHQDHYDPLMLKTLDCPIYIIGGRHSFEEVLKKDNINFNLIPPNTKYEIDKGVFVYGILHHSNGVDASCYIGNSNFSVYHGNDNYTDNSSLKLISTEFESVDVACVPYAYINWYPQLLENLSDQERMVESDRLVRHYYNYAIEQANILCAKRVIPFGANLTYNDNSRSPLNIECKTPLDFQDYVTNNYGSIEGKRFKALFADDAIIMDEGNLIEFSSDRFDKESYRDMMQLFLDSIPKKCANVKGSTENTEINFNNLSTGLKETTSYKHLVVVTFLGGADGVAINTFDCSIKLLSLAELSKENIPYTLIKIKEFALFKDWVERRIRLEEIIGSRKFTIYRSPNIYDEKVQYLINTQM